VTESGRRLSSLFFFKAAQNLAFGLVASDVRALVLRVPDDLSGEHSAGVVFAVVASCPVVCLRFALIGVANGIQKRSHVRP
jgi:hypothetical protein